MVKKYILVFVKVIVLFNKYSLTCFLSERTDKKENFFSTNKRPKFNYDTTEVSQFILTKLINIFFKIIYFVQ